VVNRLVSVGDDSYLPSTVLVADANIAGGLAAWQIFTDITRPPFNVVFDPPILTAGIIASNTAGLKLAGETPGFYPMPAGFCTHNGDIAIKTHSYFTGQGVGATNFKVAAGLGWNPRSFYFPAGTTEAGLSNLTSDGNQANRIQTDGLGGIYGTNISVINSTGILVEKVKAINSVQHGFDVTTPYYGQAGDGAIIPNPSERITFRDCIADKYGDDGFTTHGSGKVLFDNCHALGTRYAQDVSYTNSNGFEIDDYSYDTKLVNCYSTGNAHGFEVKAHGDQSAGTNVQFIGCFGEKNEVNFSARHIGHHSAGDPLSLTAKHVQVIGCTFKHPRRVFFGGTTAGDGDVADDQTPEGAEYNNAAVGAYRGLEFIGCHFIGDPGYNYAGSANALVHFRAEDITFTGCYFEGFTTGNWDIQATGGDRPAANVTVANNTFRDSAIGGVSTGAASQAIITGNKFNRTVAGSPNGLGINAYGNKQVRGNQFITPFNKNYNISGTYYDAYDTPLAANVTVPAP